MSKKMNYKLILTSNRYKIQHISASKKKTTIYKALNNKLKESKKIKFPVKFLNKNNAIVESNYELLILKRKTSEENSALLRNKLGKFVEHIIIDDDEWFIVDKHPFNIEESFWVYGYHPKFQRKSFIDILNMMILNDTNKHNIKMMMVFKNKLIIKNENMFEMVICKCVDDSVRLYNEIEEFCIKNKIKNIIYRGIVTTKNYPTILKYLMSETGWNIKKITRSSTRP